MCAMLRPEPVGVKRLIMPDREVRHSVLIVDDNPDLLKLLFFFLQNRGIDVLVADSGQAALERVNEKIPDIILLDVLMPGMDGFETLQKLKEKAERAKSTVHNLNTPRFSHTASE